MKKKMKIGVLALACALTLSVIGLYASPRLRVRLFVELYHEEFEEGYADGQGVPAEDAVLLGYENLNEWRGEHPMLEILIASPGDGYYGCYYSPDGVPLAFQNTAAELVPSGDGCWTWTAEGDNRGETEKITDHWYFFRASF